MSDTQTPTVEELAAQVAKLQAEVKKMQQYIRMLGNFAETGSMI